MPKLNFQKNKVVSGNPLSSPVFVVDPFCTPHSICLNIGFWKGSFVWKCGVFRDSTFNYKKRYSSFSKKLFVFQKTCFKVRVMKRSKFPEIVIKYVDLLIGELF